MEMPTFDAVGLTIDEDCGVATIVLDRPGKLNALTDAMLEDITAAIERCRERDETAEGVAIRGVVIEGAGDRAFCGGYDVTQFESKTYPVEERAWLAATDALEAYDAPVIAKVDGYCLGGGLELALACDFRIASQRSQFGFPEVDIGLFPSGGGTQRLPPLVGRARAKELCMTGERIDAVTAEDDGLVRTVVPADELDEAVDAFVGRLVQKSPLAVRAIKDVFETTEHMPRSQGVAYELQAYQPLLDTEDHAEGVTAFAEDREPKWKGR
jgi:enoyl-CoA hydratase